MQDKSIQDRIPLAKLSSWRVGGPAKMLCSPKDLKSLQGCLRSHPNESIFFLGLGSNVLIRDGGIDALVIATQKGLSHFEIKGQTVIAEAGVACAKFARQCARAGLKGSGFFAGIPGTIGGALAMNAGCYGGETWDYVESVTMINQSGELIERSPEDFHIAYREVQRPVGEWFVRARFRFAEAPKQNLLDEINQLLEKRRISQPTGEHTCGSVFRNPKDDYAARLIEASGLKGHAVGGAKVSEKHANFILNDGHAMAKDIEMLIAEVAKHVKRDHGISLKREVHIIGDPL